MLASSTSATVTVASATAAAAPSVWFRVAPAVTTGASLTAVTVTVLVTATLSPVPSLATKRMVRTPAAGSSLVLRKVTERSAVR